MLNKTWAYQSTSNAMLGCDASLYVRVYNMQEKKQDKTAERIVFGIMTLFFCGFGWLNLLQGGIALKSKQGQVGYVDGAMGVAVAGGTLMIAAACFLLLAHSFPLSRLNTRLGLAWIVVPPFLYYYFTGQPAAR